MAEAVGDNTNQAPNRQLSKDFIELTEAVRQLASEIPDQEAWPQRRRLLKDFPEQLLLDKPKPHPDWTYVVLPHPVGLMFWLKHELAIELHEHALFNGDLLPWVSPSPADAKTGAQKIELLTSKWCACSRDNRLQMIRAGAILASAGDELLPLDRWDIVLNAEAAAAWRKQVVRKWANSVTKEEIPEPEPSVAPVEQTTDTPVTELHGKQTNTVRPIKPKTRHDRLVSLYKELKLPPGLKPAAVERKAAKKFHKQWPNEPELCPGNRRTTDRAYKKYLASLPPK